MSLNYRTASLSSTWLNARFRGLSLPILMACCVLFSGSPVFSKVFSQEAVRYAPGGTQRELTIIDADSLGHLDILPFDLGSGRILEIRTNIPSSRGEEIKALAGVVHRCYNFLESETGREVSGNVLLFLLEYSQRPSCYRFEVEVPDSSPWTQIRVALLDSGQPLLGSGASSHITEFIYDTLPHELTHNLLNLIPTVGHDLDGKKPLGTRWFIEGTCEKMAKEFSQIESPEFHRKALQRNNLNRVLMGPEMDGMVWQWGHSSAMDWSDETDLYGLSMLLVSAWTREVELRDLIALMSHRGGGFDGDGLDGLLWETAAMDPDDLMLQAKGIARQLTTKIPLSMLHLQK